MIQHLIIIIIIIVIIIIIIIIIIIMPFLVVRPWGGSLPTFYKSTVLKIQ